MLSDDNTTLISVGPYGRGGFVGGPDIAGIGAMAVFFGISIITIIVAVPLVLRKLRFIWRSREHVCWDEVPNILEDMAASPGDTQIFTSIAYFSTFRFADYSYANLWNISLYHNVLVGNILLLIASTNLMIWSITNRL
ncbi:hypothetical protein B0I35DRAFT_482029 [Stachybotrys elegans]|uniref:Uncharacterized protein n=1 Tax=Stachybotrys elegans TaxID=80388 RepID=A0A8K0SL70_9HYPO|nr:hypothetical protein B0I35DRAFT_482029 [Stachybotrys elegans]